MPEELGAGNGPQDVPAELIPRRQSQSKRVSVMEMAWKYSGQERIREKDVRMEQSSGDGADYCSEKVALWNGELR